MKKVIALSLLLCVILAGCATNGGETPSAPENDPSTATSEEASSAAEPVSGENPDTAQTSSDTVQESTSQGGATAASRQSTTSVAASKPSTTTSSKASGGSDSKYDRTVTVDFAEYDTGNDTFSLNNAIETVNTLGAVSAAKGEKVRYVLKMPKRRYEFDKTIKFNGVEDMTLDGGGSTFIFTENVSAFLLQQCKNLKLTNFTVDYDPLRYTQGVIKAINGMKITVEIDAGYPSDVNFINCQSQTVADAYNFGTTVFTANVYDLSTGVIKANSAGNYVFKNDAVSKGGRLVEVSLHSNSTFETATNGMAVGDGIAFSYVGDKMMWAENCLGGLEFTDINVWGTSGCGFWELSGVGGSVYRNVRVEPGPKPKGASRDRFVSVNGDCLHQNGNEKGPIIENCTFTSMMDDVINIHGLTYYVLSSSGNKLLIAPRWNYPFSVGDTLKGYDAETLADKTGNFKVTAFRQYQDSTVTSRINELTRYCDKSWGDKKLVYEVTTDKATGLAFGDYVVIPGRTGSGTVIRNCTFGNNRSRGIVVKSDDVLIENNTVMSTGYPAITLQMDLAFGESNFTSKAVIRGNTIINGTTCMDMAMAINRCNLGAILIGYQFDQVHNGYQNSFEHKNIVIENNVIRGTSVYGIFCTSVDGLTVRGNTITDPFVRGVNIGAKYELTPNGGILIGQCKNVTVTGNTVNGGPSQITQAVQIDKNVTGIKANTDNKKR